MSDWVDLMADEQAFSRGEDHPVGPDGRRLPKDGGGV